MKITIDRLKKIILEEIEKVERTDEALGLPPGTPRLPMPGPGPELTKSEPENVEDEPSITNFSDLFAKILNAPGGKLNLNKADTTVLAGLIAQRNLKE